MPVASEEAKLKYLYRRQVKGATYVYFRSPIDGALVSLPRDETSTEFKRSYEACLKSLGEFARRSPGRPVKASPADTTHVRFVGGTVGQGIQRYITATEFTNTKPSTQRLYRRKLDLMARLIGATRLADFDTDAVDVYTEQVAQSHGTSAAHFQLVMLSRIWSVCRKYPEFGLKGKMNPTLEAVRRYRVKSPHKPWTEAAQDKFMETAPENLQLAKLLLHFGAQRGGDCVKMKWSDFDGKGIFVRPEKASNEVVEPHYHLCPRPLLEALKARQKRGGLAETILTNANGQPWANANSLSRAIREHLLRIGLATRFTKSFSMHGLRKNAASDVGALLLGARGIKSVTGHRSDEMANYYAQHADQIAINERVVDRWNEAIAEKAAAKATKRRASLRRVK